MTRLFRWYRPESDHYLHLDVLRFLASAAVVVYHYRTLADWVPGAVTLQAIDSLRLAVDMFFVISGVVMADLYGGRLGSNGGYWAFLRRRFARLAPLHYATLGFCVAMATIAAMLGFSLSSPEVFDPVCIPANVAFLNAFGACDHLSFNGPSWSISAEMGLYVALPLLIMLSTRRLLALVMVVMAVTVLFALRDALGVDWTGWTFSFGFVRAIPSFMLGLVLARSDDWLARIPRPALLFGLSLVVFVVTCLAPVDDAARLAAIYIAVTLGLAADRRGGASAFVRGAAPLGRLTYSLYMLHMPVALIFISALGKHILHLSGAALNIWCVVTALTLLPVTAILSFNLFETPMRRLIAGSVRRPEPPATAP